ncbi:Low affinity vacuolar monovalent cation/H(+) antiporter [Candida viswanathii]|uniref:Low affinity vacuolar monovalent cation/H(+) antiporter n=1 Tax=Candida viswanathii TaxID=5486 RepID=A0A367YLR4_9ASCO|nr:Low affinity vacuolar monovalent cation/H(+) antiporter [Candida viswanathii]
MSNTPVQGTSSSSSRPNLHGATSNPGLAPGVAAAQQQQDDFSRSSSRTNLLTQTPGVAGATGASTPGAKRNRSSSRLRRASRPNLKRYGSISSAHPPNLIYSVDDDINEDNNDADESEAPTERSSKIKNDRDYLEGYNDALKALYNRKGKSPSGYFHDSTGSGATPVRSPEELATIESKIAKDLLDAEEQIKILESADPRGPRGGSTPNTTAFDDDQSGGAGGDYGGEEGGGDGEDGDSDGGDGDDDDRSINSASTVESLNLKERQKAINSTHPFGIKIWKPSLYKKKRSVATRAEEDIHDFEPRKPTGRIFWGVKLTNLIWCLTAGLFIYVVCLLGALFVFIFSGFAIERKLRPYVLALLKLGHYWLFPFGKFVLLNKDQNYLGEDQLEGRTINEFHQWRLQEEGRLFFAPPRRYTSNSEATKPLLKDHRGRPLRDAYSLLDNGIQEVDENDQENDQDTNDFKVRFFGRGDWSFGRFAFYVYFYGILQPISYFVGLLCWLIVFTIPMAKITGTMNYHLRRHPLALDYEPEKDYYKRAERTSTQRKKNQSILLCTYRCCGFHYYKYTIDGTNIFFINLLSVVIFVILDYYSLKEGLHWESWLTDSTFIFCLCLFSIIPLAYFIGQAVASISAQSSMGVGAVINAFFSTIVEIFLYCVALNQGKGKLVEGSMIGSILGAVLLLPGLSMCGGAVKRKTQRYNPRSAGVSSTMLLYAMVTMFAPSIFYQIYGNYEMKCGRCNAMSSAEECCRMTQSFQIDSLYIKVLKPFSLIVAIALFAAYACGSYFTLRTHASMIWASTATHDSKHDDYFRSPSVVSMATPLQTPRIATSTPKLSALPPSATLKPTETTPQQPKKKEVKEEEDEDQAGGHDAPNWSRNKSTVILLVATLLYAIIAEILVDNVDSILEDFPINPKFLGLTVFALVPNTTEFLNAISFAIGGNVALSMEIGSAYALQVVLIQIPCLVLYSMYKHYDSVDQIFALVFPRWDIIATLISIYLFTYIYAEGKSNYFKGVILTLIYIVVLCGFWFNDIIEDL